MKIYTTLNQIKNHIPCEYGWELLLLSLNKTEADNEPIDLLSILESNGVCDCIWAFRTTEDYLIYRLIAADIAESVLYLFEKEYPNDDRPRKAIQAAKDFANELIDIKDLAASATSAVRAENAARATRAISATRAANAASAASAASATRVANAASAVSAMRAANAASAVSATRVANAAAWVIRDANFEKQKQILIKYLRDVNLDMIERLVYE